MLPNSFPLILSAALLLVLSAIHPASGQNGSVYFSAGYNKAWHGPSTIQVSQQQLGNGYSFIHAKGDNKTHTAISAFQLNYRLGYYCNFEQTLGIEFNYDPVNYHVTDGQQVTLKGTV